MRKRSNIVSFDEARRSSQRRKPPRSKQAQSREEADSHKLSLIFELDFGNDDDTEFPNYNRIRRSPSRDRAFRSETRFNEPRFSEAAVVEVEEIPEEAAPAKSGFFTSLQEKRRQRAKARAERQFNKTYGGQSGNLPSGDVNAGPRAALYAGEMGAKQRLATRMQDRERRTGVSFSFPMLNKLPELPKWPKPATMSLGIFLSVVLLVCMIYTPAQQYYHQLRERDRLSAEYTAIVERNDALERVVTSLQSEEGIEDKAHSEFGLVREGEEAGSVTGITVPPASSKFTANVAPGSVPAPETWYSPVLDVLFFYSS